MPKRKIWHTQKEKIGMPKKKNLACPKRKIWQPEKKKLATRKEKFGNPKRKNWQPEKKKLAIRKRKIWHTRKEKFGIPKKKNLAYPERKFGIPKKKNLAYPKRKIWHTQKEKFGIPKKKNLAYPKRKIWHTQKEKFGIPKKNNLAHPKRKIWQTQKKNLTYPKRNTTFAERCIPEKTFCAPKKKWHPFSLFNNNPLSFIPRWLNPQVLSFAVAFDLAAITLTIVCDVWSSCGSAILYFCHKIPWPKTENCLDQQTKFEFQFHACLPYWHNWSWFLIQNQISCFGSFWLWNWIVSGKSVLTTSRWTKLSYITNVLGHEILSHFQQHI